MINEVSIDEQNWKKEFSISIIRLCNIFPISGPPIFVSFNDTVYSSPSDEYVVVELRIVSSFEILGTLETRMHSYEATETLYNSTCNEGLAFYGVNIGVVCTRLWFSLRLYETDNLTNVTATVCNRHGCTNRFIEIVSGSKFIYVCWWCYD